MPSLDKGMYSFVRRGYLYGESAVKYRLKFFEMVQYIGCG